MRERSDLEPAVVSVARREPVNVKRALAAARRRRDQPARARELVSIAVDASPSNVTALLKAVGALEDEQLRARTLFSAIGQMPSRLAKRLPRTAQEAIVAIVARIDDETARAVALRNIALEVPLPLQRRLAAMGKAIADPLWRLRIALHFDPKPKEASARRLLAEAERVAQPEQRAQALLLVTPVLGRDLLEEAFAAAEAIDDADARGLALAAVASHFADGGRRRRAQTEVLAKSADMTQPLRRFDVLASLRDLPAKKRAANASTLLELAGTFADGATRCRAQLMTADYVEDEPAQERALMAAIAAAECVADAKQRGELLLLLRPAMPRLSVAVRRQVTRAVERIDDVEVADELRAILGRFFVYDREPRPAAKEPVRPPSSQPTWDLFVSYATPDLTLARDLARQLESRGMRVFLSADVLDAAVGSASWLEALDAALAGSGAMLVLLTADSAASKWVAEEWRKYYRLIVETGRGHLFSLRVGGPAIADLPLTLRMYQCIDAAGGRLQPGDLTRILDLVRGG